MRRTPGFTTRPSTYTIGHAPTSRATCGLCKQRVGKGELRIVTHAFVRPERSHDFVNHLTCATPALVAAMVGVHGSVELVPVARGVGVEECANVLAQLQWAAAGAYPFEPCSKDMHIDMYDPWNILMWKDRGLAGEECGLGGV
jgi:hypothetical protein